MSDVQNLVAAIRARDTAKVKELLGAQPEIAARRPAGGPSPILMAAYVGSDEIAAMLRPHVALDACEAAALGDVGRLQEILRVDPGEANARSADGWTALHLAAFFGRREAVALLLEQGASVAAFSVGENANQPLHAALAGAGDADVVRTLVAHGADVNGVGTGGWTPLHLAASRGRTDFVSLLVEHGAERGVRSGDGRTPAEIARERGHGETGDLLDRLQRER